MFFIINEENNNVYYMSVAAAPTGKAGYYNLLDRAWDLNYSTTTQQFSCYMQAYDFITDELNHAHPTKNQVWVMSKMSIVETNMFNNVVNITRYMCMPKITIVPGKLPTVDDDIDYLTPGEALKAHKQGKVVDWKKVANKKG